MSGKTATEPGPSPWFVAGLLAVLLAAAGTIAFLGLRVQRAEAGQLLSELFGPEPTLPFGLVPAGAATNANQQRSLRFLRPEGAVGEPGEPDEVVLIRYAGPGPVERLFAPSPLPPEELARRVEDWKESPNRDLEVNLGSGQLQFGRWTVDYVHTRLYFKGGSFRDVVKVNTTVGDRTQVLFAFWPRDSEGADPKRVGDFLATMRFDALWEEYSLRKERGDGVERGADSATNRPR